MSIHVLTLTLLLTQTEAPPPDGAPPPSPAPPTAAAPPAGAADAPPAPTENAAPTPSDSATPNPPAETAPTEAAPTEAAPPPPSAADEAAHDLYEAADAVGRGDLDGALAAFERALTKDPSSIDALLGVALIALERNDQAKAISALTRVLELDPLNDDARVDLARAQWGAGDAPAAQASLGAVFARHPELPEAMALQSEIDGGRASGAPGWQPLLRVGASVNVDSNLTLINGALPQATELTAATVLIDGVAGASYESVSEEHGRYRPLSAFATFALQSAIAGSTPPSGGAIDDLNDAVPSTVGVAATGRLPLGPVIGALDLRYVEIFTNVFGNPLQSSIVPSASVSYPLGEGQQLRALFGGEVIAPHGRDGISPWVNGALGGSARYTGVFGIVTAVADLGAKHNLNTGAGDPFTANTGFTEFGGTLYAEVNAYAGLDVFASFAARGRLFEEEGPTEAFTEATLGGTVGARYQLSYFELFAAYAFTANLALDPAFDDRAYNRHQFSGGARFWFP